MKRIALVLFSILTLLLVLPAATARAAGTWYVSGVAGADNKACNTPATACKTINAAIAKALPGDTIKVTAGIYTSPAGAEVVNVTKDLTLWGGWNAAFTGTGTYTILDGKYLRRALSVTSGSDVQLINFALVLGLSGQGGGADLRGNLTGNHVLVALNRAFEGGGIYVAPGSQLYLLSQSAVWANEYYTAGGGIYIYGGFASLTNTTVSSNNSVIVVDHDYGSPPIPGAGVYITNNGLLATTFATFADNTAFDGLDFTWHNADIYNADVRPVELDSTLISDGCYGPVHSWGYNIERADTCQLGMPGDLPNTDPQIHAAQNDGTDTIVHPLALASPAIDAAASLNCASITMDQRALNRPQGASCDIGAFERQPGDRQYDLVGDCPAGQPSPCASDPLTQLRALLIPGALRTGEDGILTLVDSGRIAPQLRVPLTRKLENAAANFTNGESEAAVHQLNALLDQVRAQRGRNIDEGAADNLLEQTQAIIDLLTATPLPDSVLPVADPAVPSSAASR